MKTTAQLCTSVALILFSAAMFASLGLAADLTPAPAPQNDDSNLPSEGIFSPGGFIDVAKKCLTSLQNKCVVQIFKSYSTGTIQPLDAACCEGIFTVNKECWARMFPHDPSFPFLLKAYCNLHGHRRGLPQPAPIM